MDILEMFPKTCSCCGVVHENFAALPRVGASDSYDDLGVYILEMRNCFCGSTLAVEYGPFPVVAANQNAEV